MTPQPEVAPSGRRRGDDLRGSDPHGADPHGAQGPGADRSASDSSGADKTGAGRSGADRPAADQSGPARPQRLRPDARRNRDQIVDAARALFAERGVRVPIEEIAKRAEVGVGTLYRRFPDRDALLRAVLGDSMRHLGAQARACRDAEPDGWQALARFMTGCVQERVAGPLSFYGPGLADVLRADPELLAVRQEMVDALSALVETAQAEGSMRPDAGVGDVLVVIGVLIRHGADLPAEHAERSRGRLLALLLDGLRGGGTPLPGDSLSITLSAPDSHHPTP